MSKPNSPFINIDSTFLDSTLHDSIEVEESTPETTTKEDDSIVAQNVLETLQKKDRQIAALTSQLNLSLEEKNELLLKMNVLREKNKALEEQVSMFVRNVNDLTIILDSERVAFKRKLQDAIQHNHTVTNTEKEVFTLKEELSEAQQKWELKLLEVENYKKEAEQLRKVNSKLEVNLDNLLHHNEENIKNLKEHNTLLTMDLKTKKEELEKKEKNYQKELEKLKSVIQELSTEFENESEAMKIFREQRVNMDEIAAEYALFKQNNMEKQKRLQKEIRQQAQLITSLREAQQKLVHENEVLQEKRNSPPRDNNETRYRRELQAVKSVLYKKEEEVHQLRWQTQQLTSELAALQVSLPPIEEERHQWQQQLKAKEEEVKTLKKEFESRLGQIVQEQEDRNRSTDSVQQSFEHKCNQMSELCVALEEKLRTLTTEKLQLEETIQRLTEACQSHEEELAVRSSAQQRALLEQQSMCEALLQTSREHVEQHLTPKLEKLTTLLQQKEKECEEKDAVIHQLKEQTRQLSEGEVQYVTVLKQLKQEKETCEAALVSTKESLKEALNENLANLQKNEKLRATVNTKNDKIATLTEKNKTLSRQRKNVEKIILQLWENLKPFKVNPTHTNPFPPPQPSAPASVLSSSLDTVSEGDQLNDTTNTVVYHTTTERALTLPPDTINIEYYLEMISKKLNAFFQKYYQTLSLVEKKNNANKHLTELKTEHEKKISQLQQEMKELEGKKKKGEEKRVKEEIEKISKEAEKRAALFIQEEKAKIEAHLQSLDIKREAGLPLIAKEMLHLVRQVIQSVLGQYRQYEKEKFSTLLSRVEELLQSMESRPPERVVLQPIHTHHNNNEEKMEYDRIVNETFGLHDYDELLLLSVLNHSQNNCNNNSSHNNNNHSSIKERLQQWFEQYDKTFTPHWTAEQFQALEQIIADYCYTVLIELKESPPQHGVVKQWSAVVQDSKQITL